MRIGILIGQFEGLSNWELRLIQTIIDTPGWEICLLMTDGRNDNKGLPGFQHKLKRMFQSGNVLGRILFKIQCVFESKFFPEKQTVDRAAIIDHLSKIDRIELTPKRKGYLDIFGKNDGQSVKAYDLDVILRHEFNIIRGSILDAAKHGIWSFHHADNAINRGSPACFWEIVLKQPVVGVTLQKLTPELDGGLVIDKAFFDVHWSHIATNHEVMEASVNLLIKNLRKLDSNRVTFSKSPVYFNPLYRTPDFKNLVRYCTGFYFNVICRVVMAWKAKFLGTRYGCWTLFIGKGNFLESTLFRLKPVAMPKGEFWADPFVFEYRDEKYVFFENYSYSTGRGKISCGKIEKDQLVDVVDVLTTDYHLSYPFVFEEDGEIYLMPEAAENNRLEIHRCTRFPDKWELFTTAFEGERIVDATFHDDQNGQKWLFLNKMIDSTDSVAELYVYQVDSIEVNNPVPHQDNPVLIDSKVARGAGPTFQYEGQTYRPSQRNSDGIYGRAINVNKITKLNLHEYEEETIVTAYPDFLPGLMGMHHLHQADDMFVIDAAFKKR